MLFLAFRAVRSIPVVLLFIWRQLENSRAGLLTSFGHLAPSIEDGIRYPAGALASTRLTEQDAIEALKPISKQFPNDDELLSKLPPHKHEKYKGNTYLSQLAGHETGSRLDEGLPNSWGTFDGKKYLESRENPGYIKWFHAQYSQADPESKLKLLQSKIGDLMKVNPFNYESGMNWLKTLAAVAQLPENTEARLNTATTLSFGLRDLMSKFSHPPIFSAFKDYDDLYTAARDLKAIVEKPPTSTRLSEILTRTSRTPWSREALFPQMGLGQTTATVSSFRQTIISDPEILEALKKAEVIKRKPLSRYFKAFRKSDERILISRLGRMAARDNTETNARVKTASLILLYHIRNRSEGFKDSFPDFRLLPGVVQSAGSELKSLLAKDLSQSKLWDNDQKLLKTLLTMIDHTDS